MQDIENPEKEDMPTQKQNVLPSIDEETGHLKLGDYNINSVPPSIQLLLKTYIEATELIEEVHNLLDTLSEFGTSQVTQKELIDVSVLQTIWARCAKLIVNIPYLDNLWDKIKELKEFEMEI